MLTTVPTSPDLDADLDAEVARLRAMTHSVASHVRPSTGPVAPVRTQSPLDRAIRLLRKAAAEVDSALIDRTETIGLVYTALLAQEHCILVGPPGTGKSLVLHEVARRIQGLSIFLAEFSPQTPAEDILGPVSVQGLEHDDFRRNVQGFLPTANLFLGEELFNGPPSTLQALHRILNERRFKNGSDGDLPVPLAAAFAATNTIPTDPDLAAFRDRFLLRGYVGYVDRGRRRALIDAALGLVEHGLQPATTTLTADDLARLQDHVREVTIQMPAAVRDTTVRIADGLSDAGLTISDRALAKSQFVISAFALIHGRQAPDEEDTSVLAHCFWNTEAERVSCRQVVQKLQSPHLAEAQKLRDLAADEMDGARTALDSPDQTLRRQQAKRSGKVVGDYADQLRDLVLKVKAGSAVHDQMVALHAEADGWANDCIKAGMR